MAEPFVDEVRRTTPWPVWAVLGGVAALTVGSVSLAGRWLFPAETVQVATAPVSPTGPLTVEAGEVAEPETPAASPSPTTPPALVPASALAAGVSISHPKGWSASLLDGLLLLQSDHCGTQTVFFLPVEILGDELVATELLGQVGAMVADRGASEGGSISLGSTQVSAERAGQLLFEGRLCGNSVQGQLDVTLEGNRALVRGSWAPATLADTFVQTRQAIVGSYRLSSAGPSLPLGGSTIELATPAGWTLTEEADSTTVRSASAEVTVALLGFSASEPLPGLLETWTQLGKDAGVERGDERALGRHESSLTDEAGRQWNLVTDELTFTSAGATRHALVTAAYTDALGNHGLILWQAADEPEWLGARTLGNAVAAHTRLLAPEGNRLGLTKPLDVPAPPMAAQSGLLTGPEFTAKLTKHGADSWQSVLGLYDRTTDPATKTDQLLPRWSSR